MKRLLLAFVYLFLAACTNRQEQVAPATTSTPSTGSARYHITAKILDLQVMAGYPQTIQEVISDHPPYELELEVEPDPHRAQAIYWSKYDYPLEVLPYQLASPQVESTDPLVCNWADQFYIYEGDIVSYGVEVLLWMEENLVYDAGKDEQVNNGMLQPLGAADALKSDRLASAELAHVFIAAMRCKAVPARFISGYVAGAGYQSWAEVYLFGIGWAPVDPVVASFTVPVSHIRLLAGMDFSEIGVIPHDVGIETNSPAH